MSHSYNKSFLLVVLVAAAGCLTSACTALNYGIASWRDRPDTYKWEYLHNEIDPFYHSQAVVFTGDTARTHTRFDGFWVTSSTDSVSYPLYSTAAGPKKVEMTTDEGTAEVYIIGLGHENGSSSILFSDTVGGEIRSVPVNEVSSIETPAYRYMDYAMEAEVVIPPKILRRDEIGSLLLKYGDRFDPDVKPRLYSLDTVREIQIKHPQSTSLYLVPLGALTDLTLILVLLLRK